MSSKKVFEAGSVFWQKLKFPTVPACMIWRFRLLAFFYAGTVILYFRSNNLSVILLSVLFTQRRQVCLWQLSFINFDQRMCNVFNDLSVLNFFNASGSCSVDFLVWALFLVFAHNSKFVKDFECLNTENICLIYIKTEGMLMVLPMHLRSWEKMVLGDWFMFDGWNRHIRDIGLFSFLATKLSLGLNNNIISHIICLKYFRNRT